MTYQEMIDTRAERAAAFAKRHAEWLANVDLDQLEVDAQEADDFAALSADY